jgi:hypothetical protein
MKIKEIMTKQPKTASRDTTLAAAHLLWCADCGILPVQPESRSSQSRGRAIPRA